MSQKGRSGACNVCAAPCSSCMHFEDMEFSGDTSVLDETSNITTTTTTKPENSAVMMDDTDESDIIEHDVKVCDICGDAGREDMLAICSRCTDGAEHTYCMRKMLRKVPANHWMCEECKFADDINNTHNKPGVEGKRLTKSGSSTHFSYKRLAENAQVAPAPKRQALESPKSSSPVKSISLSRDSSFKNSDKDRLRPPQQPNQDTAHSPSAASRLQTRKGLLVKSKSFNASKSKPKVKLVDEVLPPKQMGGKDCTSVDAKERSRMLQKSMSLKSPNLGRPSASDSKVKMLSPRTSHALDSKGSRSLKERHAFDRKNLSKSDRPLNSSTSSSTVSTQKPDLPRSESSLPSFSSNTRDLKVQTEGKSTTSKATGTRRPVEVPITSVGVSSATELKFKDDTSFTSEKPTSSNTVDGTTPEGLPRSQETSMRPRSIVMPNSKSTFCQKCKEIGHSAEFCSSNSLEASGTDTSAPTARSSREEIHGDSKLKEAIHAALLRKPEIQRKKRILDQVDDISTSSTDLNSEMACHDQVAVSNKSKVPLSGEGTHEAPQAILRNPTCDSTHSVPITDAKSYIINPVVKDLTSHSLATSPQLAKMLAIPEYDYIWRGCFEVNRSGSFLELCEGIQAHLSSCVSPRIPEVARKFPQKLSLNEVPRLSAWPTQFYDGGAKEDNIALYFFAKDLESYERNYKSLLDGMIKNDLALKGNFEGVELLIFPSNQLPENSQRWNMLYFLWGVFRARRVHDSESSDKSNVPNDRTVLVDKKAANDVTAVSENVCSPKFIDANSSGCPEISGDFSDQKFSVPISSGLTASAVLQDTKCLSDPNLSDSLRCSGPSVRDKSPPDVRVQAAELKASSMGGGVNSCNVVEKAQLYCDSELKKDVDGVGIVCEKKVLEGFSGENDSEMKDVKSVDVCVGKKRKRMFFLGESNSIAKGLLVEKKVCVEEKCEEKVIPEDLSATERRFFPVEDSCGGWKSSCQDQGLGFPNLELALGAETKPHQNKGMLPFLVDKKLNDYDRDEDVSASLSLSLSFPMNKEHQPPKQQQQQQQQQEVSKQRVNTSLLLFGGFPDK